MRRSESESRECFAGAGVSASSRFSVKSSSQSGRSCKLFPAAPSRQLPGAPSLFREFAGFNELDDSCGGDVEDELIQGIHLVLQSRT